jgi:transcriptional regulator with XRE-family HTH domain
MEIGKQIKKYRTEMEVSQDELAEKIFVSRQTISNWENDKNYPDLKSVVLLSSLFGVSLDALIKGDIEKMKEEIKAEDMVSFRRNSIIFGLLLIITVLSIVPLIKLCGIIGIVIWGLIFVATMFFAIRVEKLKKNYNIQTYKEIVAFSEGKKLSQIEKNREYGKRPYQKLLLAICTGSLTVAVAVIMYCLLF